MLLNPTMEYLGKDQHCLEWPWSALSAISPPEHNTNMRGGMLGLHNKHVWYMMCHTKYKVECIVYVFVLICITFSLYYCICMWHNISIIFHKPQGLPSTCKDEFRNNDEDAKLHMCSYLNIIHNFLSYPSDLYSLLQWCKLLQIVEPKHNKWSEKDTHRQSNSWLAHCMCMLFSLCLFALLLLVLF